MKTKARTDFGHSNAHADLAVSSDSSKSPNYYSYLQRGTLERVAGPTMLPVIVNKVLVDLPIVRARGDFNGEKVEFSFLDDAANPLTLGFRIGIDGIKPLIPEQVELCAAEAKSGVGPPGFLPGLGVHCDKPNGADRDVLRVTTIAFKCGAAPPAGSGGSSLEKALANQQKVDLYSIYFSYNGEARRDESTPTLKEIVDSMTRHPDWRLTMNGHTDGIGGDQYDGELSKRRAAAVVNELVARYHVGASRLKSAGFGKSQPKDTNDTLEGRARNRRVELMRF